MEWLRCWKRVFFEVCLNNPSLLAACPPQILFTLLISLANMFFLKQDRIRNQYYIQIKEVLNHLNPTEGLSLDSFVGPHARSPQLAVGLCCRAGAGRVREVCFHSLLPRRVPLWNMQSWD